MRATRSLSAFADAGAVILAACAAMVASGFASAQDAPLEFAVKATFVYKFADYVEWPAGTFAKPTDPLVLCVVGLDPVSALIDEVASARRAGDRPVVVRHVPAAARDAGCHILYLAAGREGVAAEAVQNIRGTPVLTITDAATGGRAQCVITFVIQDNRVRFEIDLDAAAQNRLQISSKLLNLAARVRQKP